jgi:5-methylcytosine-specific restriction endonuclease McrA
MKWNDEMLIQAVQTSYSYRQVAMKIGINSKGREGYRSFKRRIRELNLDIQHFVRGGIKTKFGKQYKHMSIDELLKECKIIRTIKSRLIKEGILKEICSECGIGSEWNGKKLTLQIDHIDGNSENNMLSNLRLLCPNCHTQTPTYGSKKLKKIKIKKEKISQPRVCSRKVERPSKEELKRLVWLKPTSTLAKEFEISDVAINKWCKSYGIEKPPRGYWQKIQSKSKLVASQSQKNGF